MSPLVAFIVTAACIDCVRPGYPVYLQLLAIVVFTTWNQALDVYGIPSAIGQPGGKGECHSGNVFEGIYSATQIPRAVEPFVAAGGVYLECGKAYGYRHVAVRSRYWIHSKTSTRSVGTRTTHADIETGNGIGRTPRQDPANAS